MSSGAFLYYRAQADRLGIKLPVELRGEPIPLLAVDDPNTIGVHAFDSKIADEVCQRFGNVVDVAKRFVLAGSVDAPDKSGLITPTIFREDSKKIAVRNLVPKRVKAGRITSVTAEAIAPNEIPEEALQGFSEGARKELVAALGDVASGAVCLLAYGDIKAGRSSGVTRALTVVAAVQNRHGGSRLKNERAIKYYSAPFDTNRHFGAQVVGGSALMARSVEAQGRRAPVQQRVVQRQGFVDGVIFPTK